MEVYSVRMGLAELVVAAVSIATTVLWIYAVFEIVRIPGEQFYLAGSNKPVWICVALFLPTIGALLWLAFRRDEVRGAEGWFDLSAPADWYMDEEAGALRWWDGDRWADRYQTWSGAAPAQ
jgi:hypothetical protein